MSTQAASCASTLLPPRWHPQKKWIEKGLVGHQKRQRLKILLLPPTVFLPKEPPLLQPKGWVPSPPSPLCFCCPFGIRHVQTPNIHCILRIYTVKSASLSSLEFSIISIKLLNYWVISHFLFIKYIKLPPFCCFSCLTEKLWDRQGALGFLSSGRRSFFHYGEEVRDPYSRFNL